MDGGEFVSDKVTRHMICGTLRPSPAHSIFDFLHDSPAAGVYFRIPAIKDLIKMKQICKPNAKDGQDIEFLLKAEQLRKKRK
jgi:hypothetical protein